MIKRIFCFSPAMIAGAIGLVYLLHDVAEAGTYNLEYPANYGCNCTPNWRNFGAFTPKWRPWPGEERLDQEFPRVIGAERLPPTQGYEELPLPRKKLQELQQSAPPSENEPPPFLPNEPPSGPTVPSDGSLPGPKPEPGGLILRRVCLPI